MADDHYPYYQPGYVQPFEPAQFQPAPAPQESQTVLKCDYCHEPITDGEEAFSGLWGMVAKGRKSGRSMILPSKDIPEGEFNVHMRDDTNDCFAGFIEENMPWVADLIRQVEYEPTEDTEIFCANCDAKIEDENVG
jgi:hypothetical protein